MSSFFEIEYCGLVKHIEVVDKIPQSGGTLPSTITFDGVGCKQYTFSANCQWDMTSTSPNITVTPSTGAANVLYDISVCYIGDNKLTAKDNSGNTYTIQCDETGVLNWNGGEWQKTSIPSGSIRNLTEVVVGDCVEELGNLCFYNQYNFLTAVTLPDSLKIIGNASFEHCGVLSNITIPSSVTDIYNYAFYQCTSLTSVTIGNGVTRIGSSAFYGCQSLTSVTILATTPPVLDSDWTFYNTNNCPIYVPAASVNAYKTAPVWINMADRITAIPNS